MTDKEYKRPAVYPETYKRLQYYKLDHDHQTMEDVITDLLDRVEDEDSR